MLFPTKELLELNTDAQAMTLRASFSDPKLLRYFIEHCKEELVMDNVNFLCALAPFRQDMPAYRSLAKSYLPRNEERRWANPQLAGIYEHFVSTSAPEQINISHGARLALQRLYEDQDLTTGIVAGGLTATAYDAAWAEIYALLRDSMSRFAARVRKMQSDMKGGATALSSKNNYAIALVEERKHQAAKIKAGRSGAFQFTPFCADAKPLLQVSSIIGRAITQDRVKLSKQLGIALDTTQVITGSWVKLDNGNFKVCGRPTSENAAEAFRRGLAAHGLGTPTVTAATETEVREAADPSWKEKQSAKVRGATKNLKEAIGAKARGGQAKQAQPLLTILSRSPNVGAVDAGIAIAAGMAYLNQTRRGPLATKVKTNLAGSAGKLGVKKVMDQGTGKYWLCLYDDPTYKGTKLVVREVWLYRGSSPPDTTKDPMPRMKPNTQWFYLVTTKEADAAQVASNIAKMG